MHGWQIEHVLGAAGRCLFDTAKDRSALSCVQVVCQDPEAFLRNFPNVLMMDPVKTSCRLTRRTAGIRGKFVWPQGRLLELVFGLASTR